MTPDELFDAWQDAWSAPEAAAFAPLIDPHDFHYEDPFAVLETPEQLAAHGARLRVGFPDARLQATGPRLVEKEFACAPMKLVATHKGEFEGLTPTGRFLVIHGAAYCELRQGRLFRVRVFFDLYGAAVQLGVLPKPGTLGERALLMLRGFGLQRQKP